MSAIGGYEIVDVLNRRDRDLLYRARRQADGASVLIKTPARDHCDRDDHNRYRHEYALLCHLAENPSAVTPVGCERVGGRPVLVIKDDGGCPLESLLDGSLELGRGLRLGVHMAKALADIHAQRVVHKNIKPQNFIVGPNEDRVQIIDFAIATLVPVEHHDTRPPKLLEGTLAYMSPEQTGRMNRGVDYRSDLYSLGITLYRMFSGHLPFRGKDPLEWCYCHLAQEVADLHQAYPHIPAPVSAIVGKLLAKVAEERYQSAIGLRADLQQCVDALADHEHIPAFPLAEQDRVQGLLIPEALYGRAAEVDTLMDALERVRSSGRCGVTLVSGYSGIGKSSLVYELHKPIVATRGSFLCGTCDRFRRDVPYAPFVEAFQDLIRQILTEDEETIALWRERISEAVGANADVLIAVIPEMTAIIGTAVNPLKPDTDGAQSRFTDVLCNLIRITAGTDRPLVIFFDDVQWADAATQNLLPRILADSRIRHLLVLLAYRGGHDEASQLYMRRFNALRRAGVDVRHIAIDALGLDSIAELIADTLHAAAATDEIRALAAIVSEKTGGNPFFVIQFLKRLYGDGLLRWDADSGRFHCDSDRIAARAYTDNVVEHLIERVRELEPTTQKALQLAACIGNTFALTDLGVLWPTATATAARALWPAVEQGLVSPVGDAYRLLTPLDVESEEALSAITYRFQHHRIQQAASAMLTADERVGAHLRIGRSWRDNTTATELEDTLFAIVGQLNLGIAQISSPVERRDLARLNLRAAKKARSAGAYQAAVPLCRYALSLLGDSAWDEDYELVYELYINLAECAQVSADFAEGQRLCQHLIANARKLDCAPVYRLLTLMLVAQRRFTEAVDTALEGLRRFALVLPAHPRDEDIEVASDTIMRSMEGRSIEDLADLPPMEDVEQKACMEVLAGVFTAAYNTDQNLVLLHAMYMVELSLRYGNHPQSPHGYGWLGVRIGNRYQRFGDGYRFARLALQLAERAKDRFLLGRGHLVVMLAGFWVRPLDEAIEHSQRGFAMARDAGDAAIACRLATHQVYHCLRRGDHLDDVYDLAKAHDAFCKQVHNLDSAELMIGVLRFIEKMRGKTWSFDSFDSDDFSLANYEAQLASGRGANTVFRHHVWMLIGHFMAGCFTEAMRAGELAKVHLSMASHHPALLEYHYYRALVLARVYDPKNATERAEIMAELLVHERWLAQRSALNADIFADKHLLVAAEIARIRGRDRDAAQLYDQAIKRAHECRVVQNEALSCELAAHFYRSQGLDQLALVMFAEARRLYRAWGASAKAAQLAQLVGLPVGGPALAAETMTTTELTSLDTSSVFKASHALSSEMQLAALVKRLLAIVSESAGAERVHLILMQDGKMSVWDASGRVGHLSEVMDLPRTVLNFVQRTREALLLEDAYKDMTYGADPHIRDHKIRALLCLPLLRQGTVVGLLYLENRLLAGAFSRKRVAVLETISTQAAISLENASLYENLDRRVAERTRALHAVQRQLVSAAHQAGMAEIASSILHNVGNVLNSLNVSADLLQNHLSEFRVPTFKRAIALLEAHRDDLGRFLTTDAKGVHVPRLLRALSDRFETKEFVMEAEIKRLKKNLDHLVAIVHMQQRYAGSALRLFESCLARELVEDALQLSTASLQRHKIEVVRDFRDHEPGQFEKHRILQILVNLITNAKNAMMEMPPGHPRRLTAIVDQDEAKTCIQICDTGVGIGPEVRDQLFTFGFTTHQDGQGLGLHYCAVSVQAMGGELSVHSDGVGRGACFTLRVPNQRRGHGVDMTTLAPDG